MSRLTDIVSAGASKLGVELTESALAGLEEYYRLLSTRNEVMNLTAIRGEEDTANLHFLDSIALLTLADFSGRSVIDIGSGAGFPGIPLRIAEPGMRLTLLDAQQKRVDFMQEVCDSAGLNDAFCLHARAEEAAAVGGELRESFDFAVSRAVAPLSILCELSLPFVAVGGAFIAMKGTDSGDELEAATQAISTLGGAVERTSDYIIPGTDISHRAIVIRKISSTPAKYPRRFAKIKKDPL